MSIFYFVFLTRDLFVEKITQSLKQKLYLSQVKILVVGRTRINTTVMHALKIYNTMTIVDQSDSEIISWYLHSTPECEITFINILSCLYQLDILKNSSSQFGLKVNY